MLKLKRVAITGGLSCGKSSVCLILMELGAYVVSADKIVHQLLFSDITLGHKVVELLGPEIMVNQVIDRSRISTLVFSNKDLLQTFEKIIHPAVLKEIDNEYQKQLKKTCPPPLFVVEMPLLMEIGETKNYDDTIAVIADRDVCCHRFMEATGYDEIEFNKRMARQFLPLTKAEQADYVIRNDGSLPDLRQATKELYQKLIA